MTKQPKKRSALSPLQQRIRDAERKQAPIGTERVGVDEDGYEMVAVLCERGFGKKAEVLRQALASGLKAMKAASEPTEPEPPLYEFVPPPNGANALVESFNQVSGNATVRFSPTPITTPPSQQRLLEGTKETPPEEPEE